MVVGTVVLFHGNCFDGIGAAFAAYKCFGDNADYLPVTYGKEQEIISSIHNHSKIIFLDFSLKRKDMILLAERMDHILILDHHISAKKDLVDLPSNVDVLFDINKSGAVIAWEYFHKNTPVPKLLLYIQDLDIQRWELEDSIEITQGFQSFIDISRNDYKGLEALIEDEESTLAKMRAAGEILLSDIHYKNNLKIEAIDKNFDCHLKQIGDKEFIVVNHTDLSSLNHIGKKVTDRFGKPAAFYTIHNEVVSFSLRSNCKIGDISYIAKMFGGGGHMLAAGMRISFEDFTQLITTRHLLDPSKK